MDKISALLENVSNSLSALFKVGIFTGGLLLFFYFMKIGAVPNGLDVGDGMLVLWIVFCFGLIYVSTLSLLSAASLFLSPIILKAFKWVDKLLKKDGSKHPSVRHVRISFPLTVLGVFGWVMVALSYLISIEALSGFLIIVFLFSLLIPMYNDVFKKSQRIKSTEEKEFKKNESKAANVKAGRMILGLAILMTPLVVVNFSSVLLDGAMRMGGIKIDSTTIYLKEPYSSLLSGAEEIKLGESKLRAEGYRKFVNVKVLLRNIGKSVILRVDNANIEVPSSHIVYGRIKL